MRTVKAPRKARSISPWRRKPRESCTSSPMHVATLVPNVPVSRPGEFLCEVGDRHSGKRRYVTQHEKTAQRFEREGAIVWMARSGGWVRKDV